MEDMGLKICPRCGEVISYSYYFRTYYCHKCGYFEENKIEEIIQLPQPTARDICEEIWSIINDRA